MVWDTKNSRQILTWAFLYNSKEIFTIFIDSEKKTMNQLPFWNHAANKAVREQTAKPLAIGLHDLIAAQYGAQYESADTNYFSAVDSLVTILISGTKTVAELAEAVDALFKLKDE